MKMYNNIEDAYSYCSDKMWGVMSYIVMEYPSMYDKKGKATQECVEIYATLLTWLTGRYDQSAREKLKWEFISDAPYLLSSYDDFSSIDEEDKNTVNSVLHILHKNDASLREEALEYLYIYGIIDCDSVDAYPSYSGVVLTGKDAVPKEWEQIIRETVKDLDVFLTIRMSWSFSHLDMGMDYDYSYPESIDVNISELSVGDGELARQRINALHFEYK